LLGQRLRQQAAQQIGGRRMIDGKRTRYPGHSAGDGIARRVIHGHPQMQTSAGGGCAFSLGDFTLQQLRQTIAPSDHVEALDGRRQLSEEKA
jgi:hypothetical protein